MKQLYKKLTNWSATVAVVMAFLVPMLPATVLASNHTSPASPSQTAVDDICKGIDIGAGGQCGQGTGRSTVEKAITLAINIFTFIIGVIAVITIIVAGLKYITSVGDPNSVNSAKNTILYAVIGLIVVAMAQVLVRFVLFNASRAPSESNNSLVRYV